MPKSKDTDKPEEPDKPQWFAWPEGEKPAETPKPAADQGKPDKKPMTGLPTG